MATKDRPKRANGSGSIGKKRNARGFYPVAVVVPGTTRRLTGQAKSQAEAAQVLARLQRRVNEEAPKGAAAPRCRADEWTVESWLRYWRAHYVPMRKGRHGNGLSPNHLRRIDWAVDLLCDSLGHHKLPSLRRHHVTSLLSARAAGIDCERRAWSASTCETVRNLLAEALQQAIDDEDKGLYSNVARRAGYGEAKAAEQQHALDREQVQKLYRAALDSDRVAGPVVALLATTGMRQHEARELRWGAVDVEGRSLRVVKAKTPDGKRTIHLAPEAFAVIERQLRALGPNVTPHPEAFVFPGKHTCVGAHAVCELLHDLCEQLSIYVGDELRTVHPHELRHTMATLLLYDDVPPIEVAAMLGDKLETILRVYADILDRPVGEAAHATVSSIFGRAS